MLIPQLMAPPCLPHTPITLPWLAGGYPQDNALLILSGRASHSWLGVRTDEVRRSMRRDGDKRGERGKEKTILGPASGHTAPRSSTSTNSYSQCHAMVLNGPRWMARYSAASWQTAMAPPVEGS